MPSLIFESSRPGTGKTSSAKLIAKLLGCDFLQINASDERGIDVIRDKVKFYAQSISFEQGLKRCVFLDEADGVTIPGQESMKSLMEEHSDNCFFILSCNNLSKIIEPIRKGRCVVFNFSRPDKQQIHKRLKYICEKEEIGITDEQLNDLITFQYPDIRSMILELQKAKLSGSTELTSVSLFNDAMKAIKAKDIKKMYQYVYSGDLDVTAFNKYYFEKLFEYSDKVELSRLSSIATLLADTEKHLNIGNTKEIIFLSNVLSIMNLL
jgi:replication factor C small subunit